jgi:cell division protein ZapA
MAEVDLTIVGRSYSVACRAGEEESLRNAAALVDGKSREALAGLGTLSESRQLLFASLLLADQLLEKRTAEGPPPPDPAVVQRVTQLADRLESLADAIEPGAKRA